MAFTHTGEPHTCSRVAGSQKNAKDGSGSFVCIRSGSKLGLVTGGEPTFTLEGRQCAGGQTYQTHSLKVRVVPNGDVAHDSGWLWL